MVQRTSVFIASQITHTVATMKTKNSTKPILNDLIIFKKLKIHLDLSNVSPRQHKDIVIFNAKRKRRYKVITKKAKIKDDRKNLLDNSSYLIEKSSLQQQDISSDSIAIKKKKSFEFVEISSEELKKDKQIEHNNIFEKEKNLSNEKHFPQKKKNNPILENESLLTQKCSKNLIKESPTNKWVVVSADKPISILNETPNSLANYHQSVQGIENINANLSAKKTLKFLSKSIANKELLIQKIIEKKKINALQSDTNLPPAIAYEERAENKMEIQQSNKDKTFLDAQTNKESPRINDIYQANESIKIFNNISQELLPSFEIAEKSIQPQELFNTSSPKKNSSKNNSNLVGNNSSLIFDNKETHDTLPDKKPCYTYVLSPDNHLQAKKLQVKKQRQNIKNTFQIRNKLFATHTNLRSSSKLSSNYISRRSSSYKGSYPQIFSSINSSAAQLFNSQKNSQFDIFSEKHNSFIDFKTLNKHHENKFIGKENRKDDIYKNFLIDQDSVKVKKLLENAEAFQKRNFYTDKKLDLKSNQKSEDLHVPRISFEKFGYGVAEKYLPEYNRMLYNDEESLNTISKHQDLLHKGDLLIAKYNKISDKQDNSLNNTQKISFEKFIDLSKKCGLSFTLTDHQQLSELYTGVSKNSDIKLTIEEINNKLHEKNVSPEDKQRYQQLLIHMSALHKINYNADFLNNREKEKNVESSLNKALLAKYFYNVSKFSKIKNVKTKMSKLLPNHVISEGNQTLDDLMSMVKFPSFTGAITRLASNFSSEKITAENFSSLKFVKELELLKEKKKMNYENNQAEIKSKIPKFADTIKGTIVKKLNKYKNESGITGNEIGFKIDKYVNELKLEQEKINKEKKLRIPRNVKESLQKKTQTFAEANNYMTFLQKNHETFYNEEKIKDNYYRHFISNMNKNK